MRTMLLFFGRPRRRSGPGRKPTAGPAGAGQPAQRQGWGVYDLLGGGMLSGLMKHSRMDRVQQQLAVSAGLWNGSTGS